MGEPRKCKVFGSWRPCEEKRLQKVFAACVCVCVLVNKFGAICDKTEEMPEILCC
jgi:hypothetical protein